MIMNPSSRKPKGLFLNPIKANCSIHESGRMVFNCLKLSDKYHLDYLEVSDAQRQVSTAYDFYAFNYHHVTMGWLDTRSLKKLPGLKLTFVLETLRNDPFVLCPFDAFDVYCALDPTMNVADPRVYAFPRPLEPAPAMRPYIQAEIPVIGSFGFATPGKGFELVVEAVNREFERAKIRINMPPGTYADAAYFELHKRNYASYLGELCQQTAKPGVEVVVTHDFLSEEELIQWCGQNTLNCFLYNRNSPGLSATTDQAISSGRPLSVSTNETFRHIHTRINPYPLRSLKDSIEISPDEVLLLQADWKPENFALRFERVLEDFGVFQKDVASSSSVVISLGKKNSVTPSLKRTAVRVARELIPPLYVKVIKRLRRSSSQELVSPTLEPFVHPCIQSHSQFNEDLLLSLLLGEDEGFYVDVGANHPSFNSNTKRFYDRGWSGINIEPGQHAYTQLCEARPRDINLHVGVGSQGGTLVFNHIAADPTLSSFDAEAANRMAKRFGHSVTPVEILVRPLREILNEHASHTPIDFLSVDAEGVDLDVLQSNEWTKFRPSLVLVEMNNQPKEISVFLEKNGYILIFNNQYNGLFVDTATSNSRLKKILNSFGKGDNS